LVLAKGDLQTAGRKRQAPNDEVVRKRVAAHCACDCPPAAEGAQQLNPGFFQLERMRSRTVIEAKARSKKRGKVRSK
jgi:hypothetical protein